MTRRPHLRLGDKNVHATAATCLNSGGKEYNDCNMSEPKRQHVIPRCYLKQFVDPKTPPGQEPYVWIFDRESKRGKKRAPQNILIGDRPLYL